MNRCDDMLDNCIEPVAEFAPLKDTVAIDLCTVYSSKGEFELQHHLRYVENE